jgi:hypothetical protein
MNWKRSDEMSANCFLNSEKAENQSPLQGRSRGNRSGGRRRLRGSGGSRTRVST